VRTRFAVRGVGASARFTGCAFGGTLTSGCAAGNHRGARFAGWGGAGAGVGTRAGQGQAVPKAPRRAVRSAVVTAPSVLMSPDVPGGTF